MIITPKDLLNEVMNIQIDGLPSVLDTNEVSYWLPNNKNHKINIYELSNKCKDFIIKMGYGYEIIRIGNIFGFLYIQYYNLTFNIHELS